MFFNYKMNSEYNEKTFIKSFINEYKNYSNDDNKSEEIFDKYYNKLLDTTNINNILHHYSNDIDLEEALLSYNYIKNKLGVILHMKLINYIIDGSFDE